MLNWIRREDQNSSHAMSSFTNNLRLLTWKQKQIRNVNVEEKTYVQNRR